MADIKKLLGNADRYVESAIVDAAYQDPRYTYGDILPIKVNKNTKKVSAAIPASVKSLLGAIPAPMMAVRGQIDPRSPQGLLGASNMGMNFMGAGLASSAVTKVPSNSLGMNAYTKIKRPLTKHEIAHQIAQKNAVDMLGLPPNNTAMDRARALGYKQSGYHGTNANIKAFDPDMSAQGGITWFSEKPSLANDFVRNNEAGGNVIPLMAKLDNPVDWKGYDNLGLYEYKSKGHDGAFLKDSGDDSVGFVLEPNQLRSRFAAFDPARVNEADLLGYATPELLGLLALGSGAGIVYANNKANNKKEKK